ncbi:unnamed protein product [Adineta ricciae]|uniref:Erythroid differentiation-related factor 1 n=1 Tax=Adineta ricciae TaxID=249248 RepID=A0A814BL27_ADIRI|nr:unnamed protein product [Adineta ricciae]CAF0928222.1 unnamed protein product [Adineta ricciae]
MSQPSSSSLVSVTPPSTVPYIKCNFLDKDTDLDQKPVWNNELALLLSYWLQQRTNHDDIFGSFHSANAHTDSLGEVDVISDAEHIKKLLKVPFNKHSQISMIVHRLGRTILLDEFDVHSHLLRLENNEWTWFRDFFLDTILRNISVKHFYKKNKTRDELIRKDRLIKFLCQSVELPQLMRSNSNNGESSSTETPTAAALLQQIKEIVNANNNIEDENNENKNTNFTSSPFQRTVNWTFENMKMLIGSDLPIFGDEQHPAVSLRLRDMNKPINVLTGIDCWLDNLMCNVPELAMCYHVDGIVQSYEIIKTEDIPYREGCQFPPSVIRDLATNLLSFLKANATKEGHTYWLFKGPDDDIVKLYDLTSLCETDRDDNPYTVPVASLLYKMAHNLVLKSDYETRLKESGTIRTLLKHCLDMLDPEKYPEYYCAAAYMMSDLFIDDNIGEQSWHFNGNETTFESEAFKDDLSFDSDKESVTCACVDIKTLIQPQQHRYRKNPDVPRLNPIHGNLDGRAREALKYLVAAIHSNAIHRRSQSSTANSDGPEPASHNSANKSKVVIPLPNQPRRYGTKFLIDNQNHLTSDRRLKAIILHKAASAYFALVHRYEREKNYGSCLRYLRLSLNCHSAELKLQSVELNNSHVECRKLLSNIMSVAGDCRLMISHVLSTEEIEKFREQYQVTNEIDIEIQNTIDEIGIDENSSEFSWVFELTPVVEHNLCASANAYEYAINVVRHLGEYEKERLRVLMKRLGNVRNEMGVYWMNRCAQAIKTCDQDGTKEIKELFRKSFESFDAGIQAFEKIHDISNVALLNSNLGRLMRYHAQFYAPIIDGSRDEFSQEERQSYHKAFDYYLRGLKLVENRTELFEVYRTLSWELSNSYFAMATSLQDHAPLTTMSQEDVEKEVIECMTRALKYLDVELNHPYSDRYSLAKYRAGTIHHRLASLLHNAFRTEDNKVRRKHLRSLASLHYDKALKLFSPHDNPLEYLRLLIEEVALADFELQNATDNPSRLKFSQQGLNFSFRCEETVGIIDQHRTSPDPDDYNEMFAQEAQRLLAILNGRIQTFLKEIVKILKITSNKKLLYDDYKEMYSISLRLNDTISTFPHDLYDAIKRMKKIYEKNTSD